MVGRFVGREKAVPFLDGSKWSVNET
jgi:hypothetical protein